MKTLLLWIRDSIQTVHLSSRPQKLTRATPAEAAATERLRASMLELTRTQEGELAARLALRIQCATSLQSLWFLRSDVVALLSPACGEAEALRRVEAVSLSVRPALPAALQGRRSARFEAHLSRGNDSLRIH